MGAGAQLQPSGTRRVGRTRQQHDDVDDGCRLLLLFSLLLRRASNNWWPRFTSSTMSGRKSGSFASSRFGSNLTGAERERERAPLFYRLCATTICRHTQTGGRTNRKRATLANGQIRLIWPQKRAPNRARIARPPASRIVGLRNKTEQNQRRMCHSLGPAASFSAACCISCRLAEAAKANFTILLWFYYYYYYYFFFFVSSSSSPRFFALSNGNQLVCLRRQHRAEEDRKSVV